MSEKRLIVTVQNELNKNLKRNNYWRLLGGKEYELSSGDELDSMSQSEINDIINVYIDDIKHDYTFYSIFTDWIDDIPHYYSITTTNTENLEWFIDNEIISSNTLYEDDQLKTFGVIRHPALKLEKTK